MRVLAGAEGTLKEQGGKGLGLLLGIGIADGGDGGILLIPLLVAVGGEYLGIAHNDTRGIEVIVKGLALAQELWREEEIELAALQFRVGQELQGILHIQRTAITYRDGTLDDHDGIGIDREHEIDDVLDMMGIEEVLLRVVIGGCSYYDEVCIFVCGCAIEGGGKVEFLFRKVFLDIIILNGRNLLIDFLHLLRDDIYCHHVIVLRQQCGDTHTDIAGSCYCYISHI